MFFFIIACGEPKQTELSLPVVTITPSEAYAGDSLFAEITSEPEVNAGSVQYNYTWFLDDVEQSELTSAEVDGSLVLGHQLWRVEVDALWKDLSSHGQAELTILNTAPVIDFEIIDSVPSDETVFLSYTATDIDTDEIATSSFWKEAGGATIDGDTLPAASTLRGERWSLFVVANDGYEEKEFVSNPVEISNAIPVLEQLNVVETATKENNIVAELAGFDNDGDDLMVNIAWYQADILIQEGSQTLVWEDCAVSTESCCLGDDGPSAECPSVLSSELFSKGDTIRLEVSLWDGFASSSVESLEILIENAPPSIEEVLLSPIPVFAADTLTCSYSGFVDVDSDSDASTTAWFVDGAEIAQGETLVLSEHNLVVGAEISCEVTPFDGVVYGQMISSMITVTNTLPVVSEVALSSTTATEDGSLSCSVTSASDDDGQTLSFEYGWKVDGIDLGISSDTITGADFDKNQTVQCYVQAHDGIESGLPMDSTETAIIANDIPFISGISVTPTAVTSASVLTCSYLGYSDSDPADTDQSIIAWYNGTTKVGEGAVFDVHSSPLGRGDHITCSVTPFDGYNTGYTFTKTLVIYNALPQLSNVSLTPDPAYTNDTLEVAADIYDPDADAYTIAYAWYVDNVELSNINSATLDGSIFFHKGQDVYAQIRVYDGFGTQIVNTPTITISNTPPPAPEIAIIPQNVYVDDDLHCSVTHQDTDEDGDPITYMVEWEKNGSLFFTTNTTTLDDDTIASAHTSFMDTWTCRVYSYDNEQDYSTTESDIDICPLGQFELCAAASCAEIYDRDYADPDRDGAPNDDIYWIDPLGTGALEAYCDMSHDDGGWTMLLSADGHSNYWGNASSHWSVSPIDFTTLDASNPAHSMYFPPSTPAQEDLHLAPYEMLETNEIRLCNGDLSRCYSFAHGLGISLHDFFVNDITHVEYAKNVRGIANVGDPEIVIADFVNAIGREPYGGICEWLGINNIGSGSAIGFLGDDGGACEGSSVGYFDQVALGLGLQSCADGNGCTSGYDAGNLAGQQRNLRNVGTIVENTFWVFGR